MLVDGAGPVFTVIDEFTVRYEWDKPNPAFLPALAAHVALARVRVRVRVRAELVAVSSRRLTFRAEAWDEVERIGEAEGPALLFYEPAGGAEERTERCCPDHRAALSTIFAAATDPDNLDYCVLRKCIH